MKLGTPRVDGQRAIRLRDYEYAFRRVLRAASFGSFDLGCILTARQFAVIDPVSGHELVLVLDV